MRVANIIEEARMGGPQIRISRVSSSFDRNIQTIVFFPIDGASQFEKLLSEMELPFIKLPITTLRKNFFSILKYCFLFPYEIWKICVALKTCEIDLVHVSGGAWQIKGVIAGWLTNKKVIWHLNDTFSPSICRLVFRILAPKVDGFIYASEATKNYYQKFFHTAKVSSVIPSALDNIDYNVIDKNDDMKENRDRIIIGTICNISPVKGLEILSYFGNSFSNIRNKIRFVIIGAEYKNQAKYIKHLKSTVADYSDFIQFLGFKDNIKQVFDNIDIYFCSSNYESSPLAVWEAMAFGKPVVTFDVGDVEFYIKNFETGFVIPEQNYENFVKKLTYLINNKTKRRKMGDEAHKTAITSFSPKLIAAKTAQFYKEVVNSELS